MRTNRLDGCYRNACERLGWTVREYADGVVVISNLTSQGYAVEYELTAGNFVNEVCNLANTFDVNNEIGLYIGNLGESGVLSTFNGLAEYCEEHESMLDNLATALKDVQKTGWVMNVWK